MRIGILVMSILLVAAMVFMSVPVKAQPVSPLALGALGAATGYAMSYAMSGDPQGAAVGGAAGITAGLLINAGQYGHGRYAYSRPYYGPPARYAPGPYGRPGYYGPKYCPPRRWAPGHYNRWGRWVPRHPRYYQRGWNCASNYCR